MGKSQSHVFCDTEKASRKGRPPKNGIAMTATERKRQQRQRERKEIAPLPDWLLFRREIWQMVQRHYMLSNVGAIVHALKAVSDAIAVTATLQEHYPDKPSVYVDALVALHDPKDASQFIRNWFDDTLLEYKADQESIEKFPGLKDKTLFDLFRDFPSVSQNGGES